MEDRKVKNRTEDVHREARVGLEKNWGQAFAVPVAVTAGKSTYNLVQRSKHTPVTMFSKDGVSLKLGDQVVYRRAREALLRTKEGADWNRQFEKELQRNARKSDFY